MYLFEISTNGAGDGEKMEHFIVTEQSGILLIGDEELELI